MQEDEIKQFLISIMEHASTAKLPEFHFIRYWSEYQFCRRKRTSLKLLLKTLRRISKRLFKKYHKSVCKDKGNFNQLLAYQQLQVTMQFYQQELQVYTDMIYEYEAYLMEGNFFAAFLGNIRDYADLRDFRD